MKKPYFRIKKLAFAYDTGWEYMPDTKEAGSVLTDIFLEMLDENKNRFGNIWLKHETEFLDIAPVYEGEQTLLMGFLSVKVSGENDGKWLPRGTEVYMVPDEGSLVWFTILSPLRLTAAKLKYAFYQKGLYSWPVYDGGEKGDLLFSASECRITHPEFKWKYINLCNGLTECRFIIKLHGISPDLNGLEGVWSIKDIRNSYPLKLEQTTEGMSLCGETPEFFNNRDDTEYEICLDIPCEKEGTAETLKILSQGFELTEPENICKADICLTDNDAGDGSKVYPFGNEPDTSACCYIACDEIFARDRGEIILSFTERFETEENLPPDRPGVSKKLYKKYPWLEQFKTQIEAQTENIYDWKPKETVWEYFNGNVWCILPESGDWKTGCMNEKSLEAEKKLLWHRPECMKACVIDGEEHFFIRLRLIKAENPYAIYYRKYIPVLENIRFSVKNHIWKCTQQQIPDMSEVYREKIYLGFDHEISPDNRWYKEYEGQTGKSGCFFFDKNQILGWDVRLGHDAFWVELDAGEIETDPGDSGEEVRVRLIPNYTEICGNASGKGEKYPAGTVFQVETEDMGVLDASLVKEISDDGIRDSGKDKIKAKENVFLRFDRIVTLMDIETFIKEAYPSLNVLSCELADTDELVLEVAAELTDSELAKLQKWVEDALRVRGSIWLEDCKVHVVQADGAGNSSDMREKDA